MESFVSIGGGVAGSIAVGDGVTLDVAVPLDIVTGAPRRLHDVAAVLRHTVMTMGGQTHEQLADELVELLNDAYELGARDVMAAIHRTLATP